MKYSTVYIFKKELLSQTLFREYGRFRYEKWLETEKLKIPYFSQSMSNSISLGDGYSNRHQSRLKSKKISFYTYQFFNFALGLAILEYSKIGILFWKLFWPTVRKKCSSEIKKNMQILIWRLRIWKVFLDHLNNLSCIWTVKAQDNFEAEYFLWGTTLRAPL